MCIFVQLGFSSKVPLQVTSGGLYINSLEALLSVLSIEHPTTSLAAPNEVDTSLVKSQLIYFVSSRL
jgi:hypothetical protein